MSPATMLGTRPGRDGRPCWWSMPTHITASPGRRDPGIGDAATSSALPWTSAQDRRQAARRPIGRLRRPDTTDGVSWPAPAQRRSARSTDSTTSPTSAVDTTFGCTSTRPTAAPCFSPRHRHRIRGLHRADSVVWDAHKMLFVPALCAFVFYRDRSHRFETFRQDAPYLFDPSAPGLADFDSGLLTVECTKRAAVYGLWGIWSLSAAVVRRHGGRHL